MVPLRAIFEGLGTTVEWNDSTQTVTAYNETTIVKATIGEYTMNVNGTAKSIDVPPMLVNDRTLVPARFVAEAFDCDVDWDGNTQTVYITTKEIDYSKVEQSTTQKPTESKNNSSSESDNSTTVSNKEEDTVTAVDKTQTGKSGYHVETIIGEKWDYRHVTNSLDVSTIQVDDKLYVQQEKSNRNCWKVYEIDLLTGKSRLYADLENMEINIDGKTCFCTSPIERLLYYPKTKSLIVTGINMSYKDAFSEENEFMGEYMIDITNKKVFNLPSSQYDDMIKQLSGFNITGDVFYYNCRFPYPNYDKKIDIGFTSSSFVYKKGKAYTSVGDIYDMDAFNKNGSLSSEPIFVEPDPAGAVAMVDEETFVVLNDVALFFLDADCNIKEKIPLDEIEGAGEKTVSHMRIWASSVGDVVFYDHAEDTFCRITKN